MWSVINAEIRAPLAARGGGDRQPHKPGSPAGHRVKRWGEKVKGGTGGTPPCRRANLLLEF